MPPDSCPDGTGHLWTPLTDEDDQPIGRDICVRCGQERETNE